MKTFTTILDEELHEKLKKLASDNDFKVKKLVNEAIEDLLKKYEKQ